MSKSRPLVVLTGTAVPQKIGPVRVPELVYPYGGLNNTVIYHALENGGRGRLVDTHEEVEDFLVNHIGEECHLIGHSQGVIHALRFAVDFHQMTQVVWGLSGPIWGTRWANLAMLTPGAAKVIPVIQDFTTRSRYLAELRLDVAGLFATYDHSLLPSINLVASINDDFVRPSRSANLEIDGIHNFCLGQVRPTALPEQIGFVRARIRIALRMTHLSEQIERELLRMMKRSFAGRSHLGLVA